MSLPAHTLLKHYVGKMQKRFMLEQLLLLFALCALGVSVWFVFNTFLPYALLPIVWSLLWLIVLPWQKRMAEMSEHNLAFHFNRQLPQLQESCQLLLKAPEQLNVLQQLQRDKVAQSLMALHNANTLSQVLPKLRLKPALMVVLVAVISYPLTAYMKQWQTTRLVDSARIDKEQPLQLSNIEISVYPPRYTGLKPQSFDSGDIEIVQGSKVRWQLRFAGDAKRNHLLFDGLSLNLQYQRDSDTYVAEKVIEQTALYRIAANGKQLPGIYTISVTKDQRPQVRILTPKQSLIELDKNADTVFSVKARVVEDYGLTNTHILASVAKGSGEAVKFRDQTFEFDSTTHTALGQEFVKHWDLKNLGMEPGDEVYFTVIAKDNKPGDGQIGRSQTVIVRWLEDTEEEVLAQGMSLNYMPEFYRSQRQIIMETRQLIADKKELSVEKFNAISVDLGHSQGDLKLRYGQYLGDESALGPGSHMAAVAEVGSDNHEEEHDHEHHDQTSDDQAQMLSTETDVLALFAHTHEDVHIGETSIQNPRAMMKKAVGFMWQAELQLMLSEPEKALPYELDAYKYLKLAKQAERIYVKRLGFEPPPVTEERRLTGELDKINSYQKQRQVKSNEHKHDEVFRAAFALMAALNSHQNTMDELTEQQRNTLTKTKRILTQMAQQRPALIRYAATVERIMTLNRLQFDDCLSCADQLQQKLWQLIAMPIGRPVSGQQDYFDSDKAAGDYLRQMQQGSLP